MTDKTPDNITPEHNPIGQPKIQEKNPAKEPSGAGCFIVIAIFAGVFIGGFMGQPSIGFLTGLGIGLLIAAYMWWKDRK